MSGRTSIQIQALVRDMYTSFRKHKSIKISKPAEYRKKIEEENKVLYDEFPSIFEMHYEGKLDGTFFDMLKLRQKVEKKELTDDEASKIIGQKLFDRYVAPVVSSLPTPASPPPMSYTEYYKQFDKKDCTG
jgi:hypothetical protein